MRLTTQSLTRGLIGSKAEGRRGLRVLGESGPAVWAVALVVAGTILAALTLGPSQAVATQLATTDGRGCNSNDPTVPCFAENFDVMAGEGVRLKMINAAVTGCFRDAVQQLGASSVGVRTRWVSFGGRGFDEGQERSSAR